MQTKVKVKCLSKKEGIHYDGKSPAWQIEFGIPYDPTSVYYQLSGGTAPILNTINKDAADMFIVGNDYDIIIKPSEE